ncbi:MAG: nucleoside recognition domain protein [Clostridia bacterium]|jgi:spore maturation protein A|nr:nucleoside recognition domain protein [Clostridia bacterium]
MLNYLWSFMIIFSIIISGFNGGMREVTASALSSAQGAVELCIKMGGIVALWMGVMRIAEKAGIINALARKMTPILDFLFPEVPRDHPARKYIATNLIANFLGLGWAATPPGLKAMTELQKLNKNKSIATHSMCMFLIVNISSVQLISINMISYRTSYGSVNPTEIIAPCIIATLFSTLTSITFAKMMYRKEK